MTIFYNWQVLRVMRVRKNGPIAPRDNIFEKIFFSFMFWSLSLCNIKKIHRADPELWECIIFRIKMAYCPKQNIFLEKVLCFWSTYCPYSLWKIWRKWLEPISKKVKIYGIPSKISANIYPCKSLPLLKLILHKNWCPQ